MKTFTITEEQIEELSKWKHGKRLMQEWFPEAFEKQLEVGKVYKSLNNKAIFKLTGYAEGYGFDFLGNWFDKTGYICEKDSREFLKNNTEATKEEWLEALKEEAKRRGFKKGVKYNYADKPYLIKTFKDKLYLGHSVDLTDDGNFILENGVWAEVIEYIPTQEEIDKVLDYLKTKNNEK